MTLRNGTSSILPAAIVAVSLMAALPLHGKGGNPCREAGSVATMAPPDEPGERMVVTGTVYRPDGTTPAAGVIVYAYQTDLTGEYRRKLFGAPRLQGWARTDASGRYELRTIRPGAYPSRSTPAHVHFQLWDGGISWQWNQDLLFQDDPLVAASVKTESAAAGRFAWVHQPSKDASGVLRVTLNIRAKATGDTLREVTWGWDACH